MPDAPPVPFADNTVSIPAWTLVPKQRALAVLSQKKFVSVSGIEVPCPNSVCPVVKLPRAGCLPLNVFQSAVDKYPFVATPDWEIENTPVTLLYESGSVADTNVLTCASTTASSAVSYELRI